MASTKITSVEPLACQAMDYILEYIEYLENKVSTLETSLKIVSKSEEIARIDLANIQKDVEDLRRRNKNLRSYVDEDYGYPI